MRTSGGTLLFLIHKTSRVTGTNYIQIQVCGTQEKNPQLGLFIATEVISINILSKIQLII